MKLQVDDSGKSSLFCVLGVPPFYYDIDEEGKETFIISLNGTELDGFSSNNISQQFIIDDVSYSQTIQNYLTISETYIKRV